MKKFKLTIIITIALLGVSMLFSCAQCSQDPVTEEPAETTTASGVEIVTVPDQKVYVYYDLNGDGVCDDGVILNLRREPDNNAALALTLPRGTELTRTGISYDNKKYGSGWSRVVYEGEIYYARNDWLSTTDPGK
ncbi:MAG: hypothetical protein E7640_03350 [Ruminococcaceae bacterium]|nr:hypothetical protein [Oscillospiraceae bacterium]